MERWRERRERRERRRRRGVWVWEAWRGSVEVGLGKRRRLG